MLNILLGLTGSVAAVKAKELYRTLSSVGNVKVIATEKARYFLKDSPFPYLTDKDGWPDNYRVGDPIEHIELRRWANCLIIAPASANTIAKITHGFCDNLLTEVVRCWDYSRTIAIAPSMNTLMWKSEITSEQIQILKHRGVHVIYPIEKTLACGDVGEGAMEYPDNIATTIKDILTWQFPLKQCNGIPINHHPGAFGFHRRKNHHTGVDLYCKDNESVFAVEDGKVVKVDVFTGPRAGHDWWEETYGLMVEGSTGVVNYGEVMPTGQMKVGARVHKRHWIGTVKRVLFKDRQRPDIPGHSTSMLHLELYQHGAREFADWHDLSKNPTLLDPTPYLLDAKDAPKQTLTWENVEGKVVG